MTLDAKYNGLVMEGENVTRSNVSSTTILVPCYPFYNILEAVGNPIVDFLSLDIEGAELEVTTVLTVLKNPHLSSNSESCSAIIPEFRCIIYCIVPCIDGSRHLT